MNAANPEAAALFHRLHSEGLLLLPNAWDAGSARLVESLGARAVATSSAAVAWAHGYADGDQLPVAALLGSVREMARVLSVPLSVDIEGGYAEDPVRVGETVAAVLEAGAVGINIEDGREPPELLCRKLEQARRAAERVGVRLFANARTDVYLKGLVPPERRVQEVLARAERYRAAGADGLFVPGVTAPDEMRAIASGQPLPLNVLARAGLPEAPALQALGVRRLSAGSSLAESLYGRLGALASGFLRTGASAPLVEEAMSYGALQALMPRG
ncbi:isocitrate lyase/phosphoenolpyruvate mutase family protein [Aggregicoccus sp. 17bor-14]|uniref:isocitrate lyase/PEP mutase family protein n=1 Tax=Myxococcaceae TaxID=31 RepID=UPI00129C1819|nr:MULTISPECIES: isocitrate lyase/phosphoenolpyruvate mutase family protein [Myxococcaceae]MBF5042359.1 isocitrate lyase/phosphoenolpyruvate mutase family protein [Simulacricoccus sp. 17bor-14]MRI88132.1 isocitrate lyase/phosphoenolpyruvate mutase family protein [Aggregicoccus sp. 17bor-14]